MLASRIIVRSFSSSSATQQLVKPPVQLFGVEGRYAVALYSAASKQNCLDAVEKDLISVQNAMKKNTAVVDFLGNPSIKRKIKSNVIRDMGQKGSLSATTTNLLTLLADNGRLNKLNQITNCFKLLMSTKRGEVTCEVITAKPLDAAMKSELESTLKGFLQKGQTLFIKTKVDPTIMGGMMVSIGDKFIDMSIKSKFQKYADIVNAVI